MGFKDAFKFQLCASETSRCFEQKNWADTALGPLERWPDELKSAVALCLNSQFPMTIAWGDPLVSIYNDGYLAIVGSKHPEAFGMPVKDVYPEIWDSFLRSSWEKVLIDGEVVWHENFLMPLIRKDKPEECYFSFCYSPISDAKGNYRGITSIASDIGETVIHQRRAQVKDRFTDKLSIAKDKHGLIEVFLHATEHDAMDAEQLVAFTLSASRKLIVEWASSPEVINDISSEEEMEKVYLQLMDSAHSPLRFHNGTILAFDLKIFGTPGELFCVFIKANALVKNNNSYMRFIGEVSSKVTNFLEHQHQHHSALKHYQQLSESRNTWYELIFQNALEGILFASPDGRIFAANPAACKLTGYTESEIIAAGRDNLMEPSVELESFLQQRHRSRMANSEILAKRKDGSTFIADASSMLFFDSFSNEERSVVMFRDVTNRKLAEERSKTTAKLEAVGRLTGGISHDFNNFLNVIINSVDEQRKLLPPGQPAHELAELIQTAALRASDLTRQLLSLSSREKLITKSIPVSDLIKEMDQIISRAIGENIHVVFESFDSDFEVNIDASQFQSAVLNLVLNAKDAMPAGGTLVINTAAKEVTDHKANALTIAPGRYAVVRITDTGIGISTEDLENVFEPFYTTSSESGGAGLGLSMVCSFVKLSGGAIEIDSTIGVGTTVTLYIPESKGSDAKNLSPITYDTADLQGQHVFLIEDNQLVAKTLLIMLKRKGMYVDSFKSCELALQELDKNNLPDIIITDVVLGPGMDGWTFARNAKQLFPDIPIVVMSGFMDNAVVRSAHLSEIPILRKPFREAELYSSINQALDKVQPQGPGNKGDTDSLIA